MNSFETAIALAGAAVCASATMACSGAGASGGGDAVDGKTGVVVARLTNVPSDVRCVDIQTSSWRTADAHADVTPGESTTIAIGPLDPGTVQLTGRAFDIPCSQAPIYPYYYYQDAGANVTWVADPTFATVIAGATTAADLHFHQLGAVDVTVSFDNAGYCTNADASFAYCGEAGVDGGFGIAIGAADGGVIGPEDATPGVVEDGGLGVR